MVKNKAIFFDRDGVLNHPIIKKKKPYAPLSIKEFRLYKNLKNLEKKIRLKNFMIFVITNQPDYKKKKISLNILKKLNEILYKKFQYDKIYVSLSVNNKNYNRKPNPGMVIKAKKDFNINLKKSFIVGDRYSDIDLARRIGMKAIFIERNYNEKKPINQICTVKNIKDAVNFILNYKII